MTLQYIGYFIIILVFFVFVWKSTGWALDRYEEDRDRRFREKVDRYRR